MEAIPRSSSGTRVVFADVGRTPAGGINWQAPLIPKYGIDHLPYFFVVDGSGKITATDDAARAAYNMR